MPSQARLTDWQREADVARQNAGPEEWKFVDGTDNVFAVSNHGRVYNHKTKTYLTGSLNSDWYKKVSLSVPGAGGSRHRDELIHRLVMRYFGQWPGGRGRVIDHRDRNRLNNTINNLAWVSTRDSAINRGPPEKDRRVARASTVQARLAAAAARHSGERAAGQRWRPIPGIQGWEASNFGSVRQAAKSDGTPAGPEKWGTPKHEGDKSYLYQEIVDPYGGRRSYAVHNLIARAFKGNFDMNTHVVDHINNDTADNHDSNLAIVSHAQNQLDRKRLPNNNTSGFLGVHYEADRDSYRADITFQGKTYHGKRRKTAEEARDDRREMQKELFGESTLHDWL